MSESLYKLVMAKASLITHIKHLTESHNVHSKVYSIAEDIISVASLIKESKFNNALGLTDGIIAILETLVLGTMISQSARNFLDLYLKQFQALVELIKELSESK